MANTKTYKGIYAMHKYWGKKPSNEISNKHFNQLKNISCKNLDAHQTLCYNYNCQGGRARSLYAPSQCS